MFWNFNEKIKETNWQESISVGDLFKDIQPVHSIDSLLRLLQKDITDGNSVAEWRAKPAFPIP